MILSPGRLKAVQSKTNGVCSVCGSSEHVDVGMFIPKWVRTFGDDTSNYIPMCTDCLIAKGMSFIELGRLKYLPDLYIQDLMRYYSSIEKYTRKYVKTFGEYRTSGKLNIDNAMLILDSYHIYIEENKDKLNWEEL